MYAHYLNISLNGQTRITVGWCSVTAYSLLMSGNAAKATIAVLVSPLSLTLVGRGGNLLKSNDSLRSLKKNEQPWANRSGRLRQMSDHERFTQVAQRKCQMSHSLKKIWQKKTKILFLVCFIDDKKNYWKN